jgi:hypothetical protein
MSAARYRLALEALANAWTGQSVATVAEVERWVGEGMPADAQTLATFERLRAQGY